MLAVKGLGDISVGKHVRDDVYVHASAVDFLPAEIRRVILEHWPCAPDANIIKINKKTVRISYLSYPDFDCDAHPALSQSVIVDLLTRSHRTTKFTQSSNPPILHRKETFVTTDYPLYETFSQLSQAEEKAGLLQVSSKIGFQRGWEQLLKREGYRIEGHQLVADRRESDSKPTPKGSVFRHKTAIARYEPSRPVKSLLAHGLLQGKRFLDYGCGQGDDVRALTKAGIDARGWDPFFAPEEEKTPAEVVNLGFVLNVIEDPGERIQTLREAWKLTVELLVVSVMHESQADNAIFHPFQDGILTGRNTFQKFYAQEEIQGYIENTLECEPIAVSLGIFYIFKCTDLKQEFVANSVRREIDWSTLSTRERPDYVPRLSKYQKNQALFDSFWQTCLSMGRVPRRGEFEHYDAIRRVAHSLPRALLILGERFDLEALEEARHRRSEDLLVYTSMAQFRKRVPFKHLPESLRYDIQAIFGSYTTLQEQGMSVLMRAGNSEDVCRECEGLEFGNNDEEFFTFHSSYLSKLPVLLRVYVGCGSILYGSLEEADVIKIHKWTGKLSLMFYDNFWRKAHPELRLRIKLLLRTQELEVYNYTQREEAQLLFNKDQLIGVDHPKFKLFSRLSEQERKAGLLDLEGYGPNKAGWDAKLERKGIQIRGHRVLTR